MRKLLMVMAVIMAVVMAAGMASATLLGIAQYTGNRPDVKYDNYGYLVYNASSDLLKLQNSVDELIRLPDGTEVTITDEMDYDPVVGFGLAIYVDENGDFVSGVGKDDGENESHTFSWNLTGTEGSYSGTYTSDYDMVEVLLRGTITVAGHTYDASSEPVLLLAADVDAFGWDNFGFGSRVDFLFGPVAGAWVDDGIWPTSPATGAFADIAGTLDWSKDFTHENKGGDKMPTPEPTTLLLLGSGLIGLAGIGRKVKR